MEALKNRILSDGQCIGSDIIKVDSFLNHQIDVALISEIGKEIARRFSAKEINKILTIEASGISIAFATAQSMNGIPVVYAKKGSPATIVEGVYRTEVTSFTKRAVSAVTVSKKYLSKEDNILIVDDFMARGEAALGLVHLAEQAGAKVQGIAIAIEKEFQGGSEKLRQKGYEVLSLAVIASIEDGHITFR